MAFASKSNRKASNLPDNQLIIKVSTSKGFITLGKIGLYNESALHSVVAKLSNEQLTKLLANAQLAVVEYENSNDKDTIELVL